MGGGYKDRIDYYYFSDCVVDQREDYYEDAHGNKIIGRYGGLRFSFSGFGSSILIGDNVSFQDTCLYVHSGSEIVIGNRCCLKNSEILVKSSVKVELGEEVRVGGKFHRTIWGIYAGARIRIGSCSFFDSGNLWLAQNSSLQIGKEFSIGENYHITVDDNTSILIGNDCMFSIDVFLYSGDCHSIFDVATGKNINSEYEIAKKRKIHIGSHVWIGMRATILYNTKINDGSIVGAMSLVKDTVPNNCIGAGTPARVIRKNISWSRENGVENILKCGCEYVNYTI